MANSSHHTPFLKHVHLRWGLVGFIALLDAIPRVIHLFYPMQYDEAYTFMAFARPPLYYTLTDYHLPNNHVFHSVLVHFSTRLWGEDPWAIRLPAFLAGWLLIPAVYLLAETLYNSRVAPIAAILVAGWPNLINYSANARGYSLIMLLTLGLFYLGTRVLHEDRLGLWLGMSLLAAIGLFTVPVMAYPLAMLGIWMVMEAVRGSFQPVYRPATLLQRFALTSLITVLLTFLFYTPILVVSGSQALFANSFVKRYPWIEFWQKVPTWLPYFRDEWGTGLPTWFSITILVMALMGALSHFKAANPYLPLVLPTGIVFLLAVLLYRVELVTRAWLFLIPFLLTWAAAGVVVIGDRIHDRWGWVIMLILVLVGMIFFDAQKVINEWPYTQGEMDRLEKTALYLSQETQADDLVLVNFPVDPQMWYYLSQHQDHPVRLKYKGGNIARVWAVVDTVTGQDLAYVIQGRNLPRCNNPEDYDRVREIEGVVLYRCENTQGRKP